MVSFTQIISKKKMFYTNVFPELWFFHKPNKPNVYFFFLDFNTINNSKRIEVYRIDLKGINVIILIFIITF